MSGDLHGQCLCGAVQVTVRNAPHDLGACHCAMCRRWTGSAFITLDVPESDMTVTGADHVRSYTSSDWAERSFCGTCGSTLWYRLKHGMGPTDYYMAAGLIDDLSGQRLTREIFIDKKPAAFAFAGPTHQLTEAEFLASLQKANPEE